MQRTLFVGLGGTGCLIGSEIERRLRASICGPDGRRLLNKGGQFSAFQPYQLPDYLKFVYADFDERELDNTINQAGIDAPTRQRNAVALRNLAPPAARSYPEVARNLRAGALEVVRNWLPPAANEPPVAPLSDGAGQYPTVGRAALFETIRVTSASDTILAPIERFVSQIENAGAELAALSPGGTVDTLDVYVAFSVAGGTGCGIFYDMLFLIADLLDKQFRGLHTAIHPLVVLPSAFAEGHGGGRVARLNGAQALVDLARYVDHQNHEAPTEAERPSIRLPSSGTPLVLRTKPNMVRTAFLFGRPAAFQKDDLFRSIAAFVEFLFGSMSEPGSDGQHQLSTAQIIVNEAGPRSQMSAVGIGRHPFTTALAASMTVPLDEIGHILTARFLARAIDQLALRPEGEDNGPLLTHFIDTVGLGPLRLRKPPEQLSGIYGRGAGEITRQLAQRDNEIDLHLKQLVDQLRSGPLLNEPATYAYREGFRALLGNPGCDPFRLQRFVSPEAAVDPLSFTDFIERRAREQSAVPPRPSTRDGHLRDPFPGIKLKANSEDVEALRIAQDTFYGAECARQYSAKWAQLGPTWRAHTERMRQDLLRFITTLRQHASAEPQRYDQACIHLWRERAGVKYLLPAGGENNTLDELYERLKYRVALDSGLGEYATEAVLLDRLLDPGYWWKAMEAARNRNPAVAVDEILRPLKARLDRILWDSPDEHGRHLLRPLRERLRDAASAAGMQATEAEEQDRHELVTALSGLIPPGFRLDGPGREERCAISYPTAGERDPQVEGLLRQLVRIGGVNETAIDFYPSSIDSLVVTLTKRNVSIDAVPEACELLREWDDSQRHGRTEDKVRWRQRSGHDFSVILTDREAQVRIVHSLLNALWSGLVVVESGGPESPRSISIKNPVVAGDEELDLTDNRLTIDLPQPPRGLSSWSEFIPSYERMVLGATDAVRAHCKGFIEFVPSGVRSGQLDPPDELYQVVLAAAARDLEIATRIREAQEEPQGAREKAASVLRTWGEVLPQALSHQFEAGAAYGTHRQMQHVHRVAGTGE
ncbi:MAG: tubulin-like doman-containing protein [Acidimicrobiia bacterium]